MKHCTLAHKQAVRLLAADLFAQDISRAEVGRRLGVSRQTASKWYQVWRKHGTEGLTLLRPGSKSKITQEQWDDIAEQLLLGPAAHGYDTQFWTLERIADLINKRTGVSYHRCAVWRLMARMDWSCQKPQLQAKNRDEDAISYWKTETWPRIKRGRKIAEQG